MNEQFTPELLASARAAETPEALLALTAETGVTLTPEEAQAHFDQFHQTGELADEELDNVAGGKACYSGGKMVVTPETYCDDPVKNWRCAHCGGYAISEYKFDVMSGYVRDVKSHDCMFAKVDRKLTCRNCSHSNYERGLWLCHNSGAYC